MFSIRIKVLSIPVFFLLLFIHFNNACAFDRALPRKVNCGDLNGFPTGAPGYELLSETQSPPGVSLTPLPVDTVHVAGNFPNIYGHMPPPSDVLSVDPDLLDQSQRFTSLQLADDTVLKISNLTPNTPYRVRLELGALFPWVDLIDPINFKFYSTLSRKVRVQIRDNTASWINAASHIRCTTSHIATTYETIISGIVTLWVLTQTDGTGALQIKFSTDGSDPCFLTSFELHEYELLPIQYLRMGANSLKSNTPGTNNFVNLMNSQDYAGAEAAALTMTDPFERGVALTHLIGWLDGSRDNYFHRIKDARSALELSLGLHPAAPWLLDELATLQRALDHLHASGYRDAFETKGYLNPDFAGQIISASGFARTNANAHIAIRELRGLVASRDGSSALNDLDAWNNNLIPSGTWEPSPLIFMALKLTGGTMVDMNPKLKVFGSDPESVALDQDKKDIVNGFVSLGFYPADFPKDLELYIYDAYLNSGTHPSQWLQADIENLFTPIQIQNSWWGSEVDLIPDDPNAPIWANLQRNQARISRNIVKYWMNQRLSNFELGGGWGDDIELLAQLVKVYSGFQDQKDRTMIDKLQSMVQYGLYDSGVLLDGYYIEELRDVEHTAEYTTNPFTASHSLYGHIAQNKETGLGVVKHLLYASNPSKAFAGQTNLNRLHFKSYVFNAEGPGTDPDAQFDILLNGRAMYPGISTALHSPLPQTHPLVADLTSWALGWRADSFDTTNGKPSGWYGPVKWPTNEFGKNGYWWTYKGASTDLSLFNSPEFRYTTDLLQTAYHCSTAADRYKFLLPTLRILKDIKNWEDAGKPSGALGSAEWAAAKFYSGSLLGVLAISHLSDFKNDTDLTTLIDPLGQGETYVDSFLLDRMEKWAEDDFTGQHAMIKYALNEIDTSGMGNSAKPTQSFEWTYERAINFYRALYPLLTKRVIHTDRVFLNYKGYGPNNLMASANGEVLNEGAPFLPLVRWERRLEESKELAIQCNYRNYEASTYSAFVYNFENQDVEIDLTLDEGLIPGEYKVEWGTTFSDYDVFPSGSVVNSSVTQKRGASALAAVNIKPGLNLVRITRQQNPDMPASNYDLTIDPPKVDLLVNSNGFFLVFKTKAVNLGAVASPQASLNFYASILLQNSSVLPLVGLPTEVFVTTLPIPSLAATAGWEMDDAELELQIPLSNSIISVLLAGLGFQVRAEIVTDGLDWDLNNNDLTRGWLPADIKIRYE